MSFWRKKPTPPADSTSVREELAFWLSSAQILLAKRGSTAADRWIERIETLTQSPGMDPAWLNKASVDGTTPLGRLFLQETGAGKPNMENVTFKGIELLLKAGANPLTGDVALAAQARRVALSAGGTETATTRVLVEAMAAQEILGVPCRDAEGGNALHTLAVSSSDILAALLGRDQLPHTEGLRRWFQQVNDEGDLPAHVMWRSKNMAGYCAYEMEEEYQRAVLKSMALWASIEKTPSELWGVVGSQGETLGQQVLKMVDMGVPILPDNQEIADAVARAERARIEHETLDASTAPVGEPARKGPRL